jgi:hypothetical protein
VPYGLKDATLDPAVIDRWWRRWPRANIAITTGERAGLFVLDVDGREGELALIALERRHGPLPDLFLLQYTGGGRGGWQAFLAWPEGREIRNSAGRLGPKLDTRGAGGYVVVPPSVTTEAYRWADDRSPWHVPPEPVPAWLLDLLDPPQQPEPPRNSEWTGATVRAGGQDRYALKAMESELALVAIAPSGRHNDQLNASAHALFRFVKDGRLPDGVTRRGLLAAARHAGLAEREALSTIASAAKARGLA